MTWLLSAFLLSGFVQQLRQRLPFSPEIDRAAEDLLPRLIADRGLDRRS